MDNGRSQGKGKRQEGARKQGRQETREEGEGRPDERG